MPFKGVRNNHGGKREGSGRKTDFFKKQCDKLVQSKTFFKFAADTFSGKAVEPHVIRDGFKYRIILTPAGVSSRTYLWKTLAEYSKGKPATVLELQGKDNGPITFKIVNYGNNATT